MSPTRAVPLLALLALGGCSSGTRLQSEVDGGTPVLPNGDAASERSSATTQDAQSDGGNEDDGSSSCIANCAGQACLADNGCGDFCYDACVSMVLLFGGADASGVLGDTWAWDGTAWSQPPNGGGPAARAGASIRVIEPYTAQMIGGLGASGDLADVWAWAGSSWRKQAVATMPPRDHAVLAGDLIFGGRNEALGTVDSDAWYLISSGLTTQISTSATFYDRYAAAVTSVPNSYVLFGGATASGDLADTWLGPTPVALTGPSARHGAAMATLEGNAYLFGGTDGTSDFADTWRFDESAWTQLKVAGPTARHGAAMASFQGKIVLFGGVAGTSSYLGDTWVFDGLTWTQENVPGPSPRADAAVVPIESAADLSSQFRNK